MKTSFPSLSPARLSPAQVKKQLNQSPPSSSPVRMSPAQMRAKLAEERGEGGVGGDGDFMDNEGCDTPEVGRRKLNTSSFDPRLDMRRLVSNTT